MGRESCYEYREVVVIRKLEMDHWVLFDTLRPDQLQRLKEVIINRTPPESGSTFNSMLADEVEKLKK